MLVLRTLRGWAVVVPELGRDVLEPLQQGPANVTLSVCEGSGEVGSGLNCHVWLPPQMFRRQPSQHDSKWEANRHGDTSPNLKMPGTGLVD